MDKKKLWLKISGSITYYLKDYNKKLSNEELWLNYVEYALPDEEGVHTYLDKQSFEWIVVDDEMMNKVKNAFMERLEKRRKKEIPVKKEKKTLAKVIEISKYKKQLKINK